MRRREDEMSEKAIGQRKRLSMGDVPSKYAKGGMVTPRVEGSSVRSKDKPSYADGVVANSRAPTLVSRAGVKHQGLGAGDKTEQHALKRTKEAESGKGSAGVYPRDKESEMGEGPGSNPVEQKFRRGGKAK